MSIYVTYESAIRFWDLLGRPPRRLETSCRMESLPAGKPGDGDVERLRGLCQRLYGQGVEYLLDSRLDLAAGSTSDRSYRHDVRSHVWSGAIPADSWVSVGNGIYVATPEHCYLERTRLPHDSPIASELDVIRLGCYLCGTFSLMDTGVERGSIMGRQALSSVDALARHLSGADVRGVRKASELLRYVLERAASPREVTTALQLSLPHRLGGFGLGRPQLNHPVPIPRELWTREGPRSYRLDICYPASRLAIEYDGSPHLTSGRMASDARRHNDLERMGWHVVRVTSGQLSSREETLKIAKGVAALRGMPFRNRSVSFSDNWGEFRRVMLPWQRLG
ncbi:MAG: DUF559 domain-containing protein [Atopobiaceae bacterium]|jgi:hypothetical protein|nr:endonuclease domain-containing protein [Atopobiaceae bacterium]